MHTPVKDPLKETRGSLSMVWSGLVLDNTDWPPDHRPVGLLGNLVRFRVWGCRFCLMYPAM